MFVEPQINAPSSFTLSWQTYNWDPLWLYQPGDLWSPWRVTGQLLNNGQTTTWLDLSHPGSIVLSNYAPQHDLNGEPFYQILISANQTVPEPGSLLALASGLAGLIGITRRRHK